MVDCRISQLSPSFFPEPYQNYPLLYSVYRDEERIIGLYMTDFTDEPFAGQVPNVHL
jgi:hypothetical protein